MEKNKYQEVINKIESYGLRVNSDCKFIDLTNKTLLMIHGKKLQKLPTVVKKYDTNGNPFYDFGEKLITLPSKVFFETIQSIEKTCKYQLQTNN